MLEDAGTVFAFCKISAVVHGNSSSIKSRQVDIGFFLVMLHSHLPTNEVIRCVSKTPIWWASHFGFGSREWELTGADGANVCHCQPGVWCFRDQSITESSKHLERDGCAPEPPHYWALSRTILSGVGLLWLLRTLERGRRFYLALVSAKHFNQTRAD